MSRGLPKEQKAKIILGILQKTKEPYTLPELEKAASAAGVTQQSVKEIVTELCDDSKVQSDKIGGSLYFWSFPVSETAKRKIEHLDLSASIKENDQNFKKLKIDNDALIVNRHSTEKRNQLLSQLNAYKSENIEMTEEIKKLGGIDPELIESFFEDTKIAVMGANRWTDNIWVMKKWACDKFSVDSRDFDRNFEIPDGFDYVED